jgi:hypothetical protein
MGVEMLFSLGMAMGGDVAAKTIHFALGSLGIAGLYLAGSRLKGPLLGAVAGTLYLVGPMAVCLVLGWAYVEGVAAFAMIAASLAWIMWLQKSDRAWLRCAAALSGAAMTFKITAALMPVAILALTLVAETDAGRPQGRRTLPGALGSVLRLLPLTIAPMIPWMVRSVLVTGNPLYPMFARLIPSRDFSPEDSAKFDRWNRYMTWGNALGRDWTIERRVWILVGVCALALGIGVVFAARARSWMARGTAIVVTLVVVAQLSGAGLYLRYWVPLGAVLTLPLLAAMPRLFRGGAAPGVWVGIALLASLVQARRALAMGGLTLKDVAIGAAGLESAHNYLLRHIPLYPLYEQVNGDVPRDERVMLSCNCSGFYIDRTTYCAEMTQDSLRFSSWQDFTSDLRRLGVTHVIAPTALATGGPSPPFDASSTSSIGRQSEYEVLRPLLVEHARLRAAAGEDGLYELDGTIVGAR